MLALCFPLMPLCFDSSLYACAVESVDKNVRSRRRRLRRSRRRRGRRGRRRSLSPRARSLRHDDVSGFSCAVLSCFIPAAHSVDQQTMSTL